MSLPNPSRETKFSGANGDREIFIFPVQLTTSRTGNLTWLIFTLAICDDYTYILTFSDIISGRILLPCCTFILTCVHHADVFQTTSSYGVRLLQVEV